jgi:hypothetical protein
MKAERRHELHTNSLALWLRWRLPQIWQQHGTKILLGLIAVAILIMVAQRIIAAPKAAFARAQESLAQADQVLSGLRNTNAAEEPEVLKSVKSGEVRTRVTQALNESDKPLIQVRAAIVLGDYYYELAIHRISDTDATTRPMSTPIADKQLLAAKEQYEKALGIKTDQPDLVAHAHIGLANIAYTRAFEAVVRSSATTQWTSNPLWQVAIDQFNAVIDDPQAPQVLKDNARAQSSLVKQIQNNPVQVLQPSKSPALSATRQSATQPTTAPAIVEMPAASPTTTTAPSH